MRQMHLLPQHAWIAGEDGLCVARENILRFETLGEDFARYITARGHDFAGLPTLNRSGGSGMAEMYGGGDVAVRRDMEDIVAHAYAEDFRLFDYPPTIPE